MGNLMDNKKDFIKLIVSTAELDSCSVENSKEFLKSEGVDIDKVVSIGLDKINEFKSKIISDKTSKYSYNDISKALSNSGLDSKLVDKILPNTLKDRLTNKKILLKESVLNEIFFYLKRIFKLESIDVFNSTQINFTNNAIESAFFKTKSNVNINQIKAYSHYALYLAEIVNRINTGIPKYEYPGDIDEFRKQFYIAYDKLNFENLLNYIWDLGVAVIPLNDSGVFHGACWNIDNSHVIVLKQKSQSHARWIFDLLHEIYHVFAHLETQNSTVLELDEMTPFRNNDSIEEAEANTFANHFLFKDKAESLAKEVMELSNNDISGFKWALEQVVDRNKIRADLFANYLAFRLQLQGENWWSTANYFQVYDPPPFKIASDILSERVLLEKLDPIDKNLLKTAIEY